MVTIQQGLREDGLTVSMVKLCRWFGVPKRTMYYRSRKAPPKVQEALVGPIKDLIEDVPSFGYRTVAGLPGMNKNTGGLAGAQARCVRPAPDSGIALGGHSA